MVSGTIDKATQAKARASVEALLAAAGVIYERLGRLEKSKRETDERLRKLERALVLHLHEDDQTEDLP